MTEETGAKPFARARLQDTEEMAQKFYAFGLEGIPNWVIALRLGCHVNTVGTFLRRAPRSKAALARGRDEAVQRKGQPGGSAWEAEQAWRGGRKLPKPKPGEPCPACGQMVGGNDYIVLTPQDILEAERQFDEIINRHLANREAEQPGTAQPETPRSGLPDVSQARGNGYTASMDPADRRQTGGRS